MSRPYTDRLGRPTKAHTQVRCVSCGCRIGLGNTRFGAQALKKKNPKCGSCYLKYKAAQRKANGLL